MNAQPDLSRRAFFTALPAVSAGLAIPAHAADEATPHWSMLVDTRRCIACQACTMACSMENVSPEGQFRTVVATYAITDQAGKTGLAVLPRLCNHCEEPPCIPVCPVGATFKRPDGIVLVDYDKCIGCKYCAWACPYGARELDEHQRVMKKCTLCVDRIYDTTMTAEERRPACVRACPTGAAIRVSPDEFLTVSRLENEGA